MGVGVAFDLEGASVDLEDQRHEAHLRAAASFDIAIDREFAIAYLPHFIGGPDELVAEEIFALARASLPMDRTSFVDEFLSRDRSAFDLLLRDCPIAPRDGYLEFVDWLHSMRVPTSIGSLTSTDQATVILERSGLARLFGRCIVLREDVKEVKPAPDVFLATARLMDISPTLQIVYEDSPRGVMASYRAGSHPIGMPVIDHPAALRALEAANPLAIFSDWRDANLRSFTLRMIAMLLESGQDARL